jgi:hypothetical protein
MAIRQVIKDHGYNAFMHLHEVTPKVYTKVGFPENGEVGEPDDTSEGEESVSMSEIIQLAATHEFGTSDGRIPMRSFMRAGMDENLEGLKAFKRSQYLEAIHGGQTLQQAIGLVGEWLTGKLKLKIIKGPFIPNAPATLAAKAPKTKPLINTGRMINSLQHEEMVVR